MKPLRIQLLQFVGALSVTLHADSLPVIDKSQFDLFHPVPAEYLREMSTDRPDKTESPFTVDAGHFQIEMDIVNYSYERHRADSAGVSSEQMSLAPMNIKAGLLNRLDLQVILKPFNSVRTNGGATGTVQANQGVGDTLVRSKWNLWGNDEGSTAGALMPYLKIPTNQNGLGNESVEGGLIFPVAAQLPLEWNIGGMLEVDVFRDSVGPGYHPEFVSSLTLSHDHYGKLAGFVEFYSSVNTERGAGWIGTVDFGLTYAMNKNLQLDAGMSLGVTSSANAVNPFVGLSWRF